MDSEDIEQSPLIYARIIGIIEAHCPACGTFIRHQTGPRGPWIMRCTRAGCEARWAFGVAVHPVASGFKLPPQDHVFPSASKIACIWRSGRPLNTLGYPT